MTLIESRRLVELAEKNGVILTIEREPLQPLRMGNHVAVIRTWPKREVAVPGNPPYIAAAHEWPGPGPEPAKWTAADGTVVYRSYADYIDD